MFTSHQSNSGRISHPVFPLDTQNALLVREWFAVYTLPRNEQSVLRRLEDRQVEAFLPTYEVTKVWKNRQKVTLAQPLFPSYLFVHVNRGERVRVLDSMGVLSIVGNSRGPLPLHASEVESLRHFSRQSAVEPFNEIPVGTRVRVKHGAMQGVEGVLVNRKNSFRFVITIQLINQSAALEISPEDLELISPAKPAPGIRVVPPARIQ